MTTPMGPSRARILRPIALRLPGLIVTLSLAALASVIGAFIPIVGSAVPAVVLGAAIAAARTPPAGWKPGIAFASRFLLQLSVVLLGARLSLGQVAAAGLESLPVMLGTLVVCLLAGWLLGRALGVVGDLRTLITVGTGICGGSAIAATAPVIGAASANVAYAISTIFLFNIAAVIAFPLLGHALGLSQHAFGLFAGTAVNDTSSVVATATTYGPAATDQAVVVKLVRTLMIIPITVALGVIANRRRPRAGARAGEEVRPPLRVLRLVPWFLIGFVLMAAANSVGLIPHTALAPVGVLSVFLVSVALAGIGLSTDVAALRRAGWRPLLLGSLLWIAVAATSLGLQALTGTI